ncbi:MAG: hypothetical protein RL391_244 [Actinomycetota bacterium]|jgi:hypothetical protein
MIKRFIWFVGGTLTGVVGTALAGRRVKRRVRTLAPVRVAQDTSKRLRGRLDEWGNAFSEGRQVMQVRETELRARIEGRSSSLSDLDGPVTDADALLVDGEPIEPGRVVVLRDVADQRPRRRPR